MQFSFVALRVGTVKVIDAEGVVAGLLNLNQEVPRTDAVDATRRNEETITGVRLVASEVVGQRAVFQTLDITPRREVRAEAGVFGCHHHSFAGICREWFI